MDALELAIIGGGPLLLVGIVAGRACTPDRPWVGRQCRVVGWMLALFSVSFYFSMHGPSVGALVPVAATYPLMACERGKGYGSRVGVAVLTGVLTLHAFMVLLDWRYGVRVSPSLFWLIILAPLYGAMILALARMWRAVAARTAKVITRVA